MPNEILLVEDDRDIVNIIKRYLDSDEFTLTWCPGVKSIDELGDKRFDVALLDIMLGNASGLDVCARLRARYDCPLIFVSAIDDSETIIRALEMGGDDYVTKPFDAQVLVARIKANLRRSGSFHRDEQFHGTYEYEGFSLDTNKRIVTRENGSKSSLTPLEFQLLLFLIRNPEKYYTSEELYTNIWGKQCYGDTRTVIVLIHSLRKKIETDPQIPRHIINKRGRGYRFVA